jgi:hypothetical protein
MLYTYIQEAVGSNIDQDISYLGRFTWFFSFLQGQKKTSGQSLDQNMTIS